MLQEVPIFGLWLTFEPLSSKLISIYNSMNAVFGLNTEKYGSEETPYLGTLHTV